MRDKTMIVSVCETTDPGVALFCRVLAKGCERTGDINQFVDPTFFSLADCAFSSARGRMRANGSCRNRRYVKARVSARLWLQGTCGLKKGIVVGLLGS